MWRSRPLSLARFILAGWLLFPQATFSSENPIRDTLTEVVNGAARAATNNAILGIGKTGNRPPSPPTASLVDLLKVHEERVENFRHDLEKFSKIITCARKFRGPPREGNAPRPISQGAAKLMASYWDRMKKARDDVRASAARIQRYQIPAPFDSRDSLCSENGVDGKLSKYRQSMTEVMDFYDNERELVSVAASGIAPLFEEYAVNSRDDSSVYLHMKKTFERQDLAKGCAAEYQDTLKKLLRSTFLAGGSIFDIRDEYVGKLSSYASFQRTEAGRQMDFCKTMK